MLGNGQDGSYVAEHLIAEGKTVIGIGRQKTSRWLKKQNKYTYISKDLSDTSGLVKLLHELKPSLVFNAATVHGANSFDYEDVWQQAHLINTTLTNGILDYISKYNQNCTYLYLSSSKSFGSPLPNIIDEKTQRKGTCIYSITKNAASDLINYYRTKYDLNAKVVWTFNHESPRRQREYFIPKIVNILAQALRMKNYKE